MSGQKKLSRQAKRNAKADRSHPGVKGIERPPPPLAAGRSSREREPAACAEAGGCLLLHYNRVARADPDRKCAESSGVPPSSAATPTTDIGFAFAPGPFGTYLGLDGTFWFTERNGIELAEIGL